MNTLRVLSDPRLAEIVLNLSVQALVLLIFGWIATSLLSRRPAPLRSGLLVLLLLALALWPLKTLFFHVPEAGLFRITTVVPPSASSGLDPWLGRSDLGHATSADMSLMNQGTDHIPESGASRPGLPFWRIIPSLILYVNLFGGLWAAGTLFSLAWIAVGFLKLAGFTSTLRSIQSARHSAIIEAFRSENPSQARIAVNSSSAIKSPLAFGIVKQRIVIPESLLTELRSDELRSLLVHEGAHLRHHDQVTGLLQRLVIAFYWWNPLTYVLSGRLSAAREEVCDNYGILRAGARSYAESLLEMAQKARLCGRWPATVGLSARPDRLESRLRAIIVDQRDLSTRLSRAAAAGVASLIAGMVLAVGSHGLSLREAVSDHAPTVQANAVPLPMAKKPLAITAGISRVYMLDHDGPAPAERSELARQVKVMSASNFTLTGAFGKTGSGPTEFRVGPGIPRIYGESVWCDDIDKMLIFSQDGSYQRTIKFPQGFRLAGFPLLPVGDHFCTLYSDFRRLSADGSHEWQGHIYDRELKYLHSFHSAIPSSRLYPPPPPPPPPRGLARSKEPFDPPRKTPYQAIPDCIDMAVAGNRIIVADSRRGFYVAVYDEYGRLSYEIQKKFDPVELRPSYKDEYLSHIRERSPWLLEVAEFEFPETYPAFMGFKVADGKIYISTYARRDGMNELIVMDLKGNILKRSFSFPLNEEFDPDYHNFNVAKTRYDISSGRLLYLAKNEGTGLWEIRVQRLE